MDMISKGLIGLSALAFILAVVGAAIFAGPVFGIPPEAFSRACSNLALLAIALSVTGRTITVTPG